MALESFEIATDRLLLWAGGPEAAGAWWRYHSENWSHLKPWSPPVPPDFLTLGYWERRLVAERAAMDLGRAARWAISWRDDATRRVIGTVGLSEILRGPAGMAYLGYGLAAHEQKKGVMTEAVRAATAYSFETLRLHQVHANYVPTNEASARVLRRAGFTVYGYVRDYLYIDGAWRDHVMTVLTDPTGRPPDLP
ncbi:MAG TPA: GNAT family protein [Kofleriaceae bacterium]|nr:GNAT family protein [Kofleriaceae bacterium]